MFRRRLLARGATALIMIAVAGAAGCMTPSVAGTVSATRSVIEPAEQATERCQDFACER